MEIKGVSRFAPWGDKGQMYFRALELLAFNSIYLPLTPFNS